MQSAAGKGKQATRGQKQIYEENQSTIKFYAVFGVVATLVHMVVAYAWQSCSTLDTVLWVTSASAHASALFMMTRMAKSAMNERGHVIDAGLDLNMSGGIGEYMKDLVILTSIVQCLSLVSRKFWLLFLAAPAFGLYKLWVGVLGPWFFADAPAADDDADEKRRKKKERKMKRMQ